MTSIMFASTWLVPFYPKPVSFGALHGPHIEHCTQSLTKGDSSARVVLRLGHPSSAHRRILERGAESMYLTYREGMEVCVYSRRSKRGFLALAATKNAGEILAQRHMAATVIKYFCSSCIYFIHPLLACSFRPRFGFSGFRYALCPRFLLCSMNCSCLGFAIENSSVHKPEATYPSHLHYAHICAIRL